MSPLEDHPKGSFMKHMFTARPILAAAVLALLCSTATSAHHSWRKYHWSRTTPVLSLDVGNNVSSAWNGYLTEAIEDWNGSDVLQLTEVPGHSNAECAPTSGRIEACNGDYGQNGWLGVAQIWIRQRTHIYQGTTLLNDTYFDTPTYNTAAWRSLVTCQEIAHDFGLDHQDERFDNRNLGSCMDYTNDPDGGAGGFANNDPSNEHPNAHDFEQLVSIYGHVDSTTTAGAGSPSAGAARPEAAAWGRLIRTNPTNRVQVYEKALANGDLVITHVFWADPEDDRRGHDRH
jgi:hypothetical protein